MTISGLKVNDKVKVIVPEFRSYKWGVGIITKIYENDGSLLVEFESHGEGLLFKNEVRKVEQ